MPFGRVAEKEFGTYFIGYARSPRTIEQMLQNMFVGRPPGNYDRLLDFSSAKTGNLFFVPSATFLENVGNDASPAEQKPSDASAPAAPQPASKRDGSLGIGSLKGDHSS
jgi:porphyrinogen peroxidase